MSRTVSNRALAAFFKPECDENFILLLRLSGANLAAPIYLCDGWTKRLTGLTTDDEVIYGLTSEGVDHMYLPFQLSLPTDDEAGGLRAEVSIYDATRQLMPVIRALSGPPTVRLQVVMQGASAADNGTAVSLPEISIDNMELRGIGYDAGTITGTLMSESLANEPFPCHTMTPSACPGLF